MASDISPQLSEQIVRNAQEAIIYADRAGLIQLWNTGAEAMFGYTAEETLGKNLDLIIPERQRQRHWDGYEKVMATGETRYGKELLAVPALHKNGTRISLEFSIVLVRDETGSPQGVAAIMREVTVRRQQEQEVKQRLAALEAKVKA
jgi:PAS domain S-box-containing protein